MSAPTATRRPLVLNVHLCAERRSYKVTFAPGLDAKAAAWIASRASYCAISEQAELDEDPSQAAPREDWPLVLDVLYPVCEHGLSADLCMGPDHYMSAAQERERGW